MRESNIEGIASHGGPEPCVGVREGGDEASVGVRAGRAIEPRNLLVWGADAVLQRGRQHRLRRFREPSADSAGSKNLCMYGISGRENREIPRSSACRDGGAGRAGKA
jgi:hypothetical protein